MRGDHAHCVSGVVVYSFADTARILRVSPARLRYWERTALVNASSMTDAGEPVFAWQDLVELRTLVRLIDRGIPVQRIRRSLDRYRRRLEEGVPSVSALALADVGADAVALHHEGAWEAPNGQLLFDFDEDLAAPAVASLDEARFEAEGNDGGSALAWFERGCAFDGEPASYEQAIDAYRHAIDADPDFADAHCNLGTVYFNRGHREAAKAAYIDALAADPGHLEANFNLANLLEELGQRDAARAHYEAAVASDPFFAEARLNLALLYEKLDARREAREQWRHYLQQVSEGHWADIARERLGEPPWPRGKGR